MRMLSRDDFWVPLAVLHTTNAIAADMIYVTTATTAMYQSLYMYVSRL